MVPVTREAAEGRSLEPKRLRLQQASIMLLHSSLGNRARLCLKIIMIIIITLIIIIIIELFILTLSLCSQQCKTIKSFFKMQSSEANIDVKVQGQTFFRDCATTLERRCCYGRTSTHNTVYPLI